MTNMSHCRFHNTLADLKDCLEHMDDKGLSEAEDKERQRLILLCHRIAGDYDERAVTLLNK